MTDDMCACGQPLHYTDPVAQVAVESQVARLGETVLVQVADEPFGVRVPRHYIALHGIRAQALADLQERYGWEKVPA